MDQITLINGPAGVIEASVTPAPQTESPAASPWAVLCHPHPLYGGSMHDVVVATAAGELNAAGFNCLRFNFRGVGASDGSYDNGVGETDDLLAIIAWLRAEHAPTHLTLVGYSFGSQVVWQAQARSRGIGRVILIAPIVDRMDYSAAAPPETRVDIVVGSSDQFVSTSAVEEWADNRFDVHVIDGADHVFSGCWDALGGTIRSLP